MKRTHKAVTTRIAKAKANYDKTLEKYGRVIRLQEWVDSRTPILHRCLRHGEEHMTAPVNLQRGQGLKCCKQAAIQEQADRRKEAAAARYDEKLRAIGKLERLESYQTALTPILHRCIRHGVTGMKTPNAALSGKGLRCCQQASNQQHVERLKLKGLSGFMQLVAERSDVELLGEYIDAHTPIRFRCLTHDQEHVVPPSYLSKRSGKGGFSCCRDAQIQRTADQRKAKAAAAYDQKIAVFGRLKRLDPYAGRTVPILHECLDHGERHMLAPGHALRGDGLTCCNRGAGWDTFERILEGKRLKSNLAATEFYIFRVPETDHWFKVGVAISATRRSRDPMSKGIYGELVASWPLSCRRNAVLIETVMLRDQSLRLPNGELDHLKNSSGYSEIRGADIESLLPYVPELVDSLDRFEDNWAAWALENIPMLRDWERRRLTLLSH